MSIVFFFFQLMTFLFKNNQSLNYKNKPLEYTNTTHQKLYYSFLSNTNSFTLIFCCTNLNFILTNKHNNA